MPTKGHLVKTPENETYSPAASLCARVLPGLLTALTATAGINTAMAQAEAPAPSRVHALVNLEFADKYLTPRGMIVQNEGMTIQPLVLGLINVYKAEDSFINDVTLVPGVWADFATRPLPKASPVAAPRGNTSFLEIDPIAGISVGFAKNFKLDVTYTAFAMQILDIPFSEHLETKLSYNDTELLGAFALHPYIIFWKELSGKSTAAQVPFGVPRPQPGPGSLPGSSFYFDVGIAPSYTFESIGLKVELPCRVLLPEDDFYGEYYADSSTVGLYELGIKGTIPLKFMPAGYGNWSFHAGFKYMSFEDDNLAGMQEFNGPGRAVDEAYQIYCGFSAFF